MSKHLVDANYRFIAAYNEVNARIAQRHQALGLYISIVIGLLAAMVALRSAAAGTSAPVEWLVFGFPVASLGGLLNLKAERALTNLRRFLAELERLGDARTQLPGYNIDPRWAAGANRARRFHDYTVALLIAAGNLLGIGAGVASFPGRFNASSIFVLSAAGLACASMPLVLLASRWSYTPEVLRGESP